MMKLEGLGRCGHLGQRTQEGRSNKNMKKCCSSWKPDKSMPRPNLLGSQSLMCAALATCGVFSSSEAWQASVHCVPPSGDTFAFVSDWHIRRLRWVVIWSYWIATRLLSSFLGTRCCAKEQEATEVLDMLSVLEDWNLYVDHVVHALGPFSCTSKYKSSNVQC